jgi:hypothetical protein
MKRLWSSFGGLATGLILAIPLSAQTAGTPGNHDVSAELLRMESPPNEPDIKYWDNLRFFVHPEPREDAVPDVTASLYVLATYWRHKDTAPDRLPNSLRDRLLEASEQYPDYAADLAHFFPRTPDTDRRVLAILNRAPSSDISNENRVELKKYLSRTSKAFRSELLARAEGADEGEGYIENADDVKALARLDWDHAAPLLEKMIVEGKPRTSALALSLQYEHAVKVSDANSAKLQVRLQRIADDQSAPAKARDVAIEALMKADWEGRDSWFLSLFSDEKLASASDGVWSYSPLHEAIEENPSFWIPQIARLVESTNPNVRRNAIFALVLFQQENARADAILPLLPWLSNPHWVTSNNSGDDRRNLIYSLTKVRVPESIPGLIHVLQHPEEAKTFEIGYAAMAISQCNDGRAVPALRALLTKHDVYGDRFAVAEALLASGDVSLNEKVEAVTLVARVLSTSSGRELINQSQDSLDEDDPAAMDGQLVLGLAVVKSQGGQQAFVEALERKSRSVRADDPATADALDALLAVLPSRQRDEKMISAIASGEASAPEILAAIKRSDWLALNNADQLTKIAAGSGSAAATAAMLLGDEERKIQILSGTDATAQKTLLAELRLTGEHIWGDAVEKLVDSTDPEVAEAANAYLPVLHRVMF